MTANTKAEIQLAAPHQALPTRSEFDTMLQLANAVAKTEFVPKGLRGFADRTLAAIMFGREIGLPPMVAMSSVYIIDGHPTMSAHLLLALIRQRGHTIVSSTTSATRAEITGRRTDGEEMTVAFTIDEARAAGLAGKDNWKHYPADMLWARCVSRLYRRLFSDVAYGATLYVPEDFGTTDAEAADATVFTDAQVAEMGVMMALEGFVPKPADGKGMGELVKKEVLAKVMREQGLPAWKDCTPEQREVAALTAKARLATVLDTLGILTNADPFELTEDQARAVFDLVRDGVLPTEGPVEAEVVETTSPGGQDGAVVDAEEVVPLDPHSMVDQALAEQRWQDLMALLALDLTSGTNDQIEERTRRLYRLMGELGLWDTDQLHLDLAPHKHYSDLGRKADFQRFALVAHRRARERVNQLTD